MQTLATLILTTALLVLSAAAMSGQDILDAMDRNRDFKTMRYEGTMTIHIGDEVRTKKMETETMTEGNKALVRFTNPSDEGTRYLMIGDNLWIYFPTEEDVVRISGHMLKEGMMGSDLSYEDALESDKLASKYTVSVAGQDTLDGHDCYVVALDAKVKNVPYYKRKMWVDTKSFVAWKEEMYAKSGKLLKIARVTQVKTIAGRTIPVEMEMVNTLRRNSKTIFSMQHIEFDAKVNENQFSLRYLKR